MKVYVDLTVGEKLILARMHPNHIDTYLTVYSEEGVFDVRNKIYKQCLIEDKPATTVTMQGRNFVIDRSTVVSKEMWQIPFPNHTVRKKVFTYNLPGGLECLVEFDTTATYTFNSATVEEVAAWLQQLK